MAILDNIDKTLADYLRANSEVAFIHFHWITFSGILRTRVVTRRHAVKLAKSKLPMDIAVTGMLGLCSLVGLPALVDRFSPGGSCSLHPDWSSLRVIGPEHASVICSVSEKKTCHPGLNLENPFLRCPRDLLQRTIQSAAENESISFLVGFELEFFLLTEDQHRHISPLHLQPSCSHAYSSFSMRGPLAVCVEDCTATLQAAGVEVEQYHAEDGAQQFEIITGPLPALEAVDTVIQSQEIVKLVAQKHGLQATFLPILPKIPTCETSGLHVHLSLHRQQREQQLPSDTTTMEEAFLSGILRRLPGLCSLGMPSASSYSRMKPTSFGEWAAWGTRNRRTPIRKIEHNRWEFRAVDATANVYLAVAGYIAAGLLGIRKHEVLHVRDCTQFMDRLNDADREALGITTRLPSSFAEARAHMEESGSLKKLLGEELISFYFDVKDGEANKLSKLTEDNKATLFLKNY